MKFYISIMKFHCFLIGLCCLLFAAPAAAQKMTPPARPDIAPKVSRTYPHDRDNNRIEDRLFDRAEKALRAERLAVTPEDRDKSRAELAQMINLELIFSEQITQEQIDDFLLSGGEISYVYKAVSYGWNGRLPLGKIKHIVEKMGSGLVLIEEPKEAVLHMRIATQTGRVRPVWANGFAGSTGYDGASNINIAIIDTGVDDSHSDLSGRNVYWHDYTTDAESAPRDVIQHGSHVAGIALGTGGSLGTGTTLYYTDSGSLSGVSSGSFYPSVIDFPSTGTSWSSTATWLGGGQTTLYHAYTPKGASTWYGITSKNGTSGVNINTSFTPLSSNTYSAALLSNGIMSTYAVRNAMTNFSAVGDGFNTLRGAAPGSSWVGAKVFTNSGSGNMSSIRAAIDDMVTKRETYNIKIMNLSLGVNGSPGLDPSTRQKINNAAMNGILPVISAGNDGPGSAGANEVDDPGRAAMSLTVGAANDINELTRYSSSGFLSPGSTAGLEEDFKPDIIAPGGSEYYSNIMSVDSNDADGENASFSDVQSNDYYNIMGTSMASPFVAGSAALLIDALQSTGGLTGASWNFSGSDDVRRVKMLLCATATETNKNREANTGFNPTLERASGGPDGYPSAKDRYEGYGMLNVDAAIEGGTLFYSIGDTVNETLGGSDTARRVWARKISLTADQALVLSLTMPATGDFDLYLYSFTPNSYGTPVILASGTNSGSGINETINYTPASDGDVLLVIKKVSGLGQFTVSSHLGAYTIDVSKSGAGAGVVTSSPSGIDCGADCSEGYSFNTVVTLTAIPDAGSAFAGWSGDGDCADGVVTIDNNRTCVAAFNLQNYSLTVNKVGTGLGTVTSLPSGIDCGADCSQDYTFGTIVTLTANPDAGSIFTGWSGDADCSDGIVTMSAAQTCIAVFNSLQYQLTTSVSPAGGGSITPDCSGGCYYDNGTMVNLTATENAGYFFDHWTNCDSPSSNICIETMDADYILTANFEACYQPVRIAGTIPVYYSTIQSAYDAAIDGDVIQSRAVTFTNSFNANRNIGITLEGGYGCDYSSVTGNTILNGVMTISNGAVMIMDYILGN